MKNRLNIINLISLLLVTALTSYLTYDSFMQHQTLDITSILALSILAITAIAIMLNYKRAKESTKSFELLENIIKKYTKETSQEPINIYNSQGMAKAYDILENIIEETKKDKELAQEASEAKSMFLANMSHEIRTPLNGIVGFTELLKDSGLNEEQVEFIDIIEKSSENLLEIINNILDLSKIESNKLEIENIVFDPIVEFESAVEVYAVRASEKNINLGCFIDPQLHTSIKGDPTKIKEILINLLSNAVKFTPNGGEINVSVKKEASENSNAKIRFEVQDNGIGVSEEQKEKIFEAFSQADTSITRKYGGTGLGLTISSNFIKLMGGELDLSSKPGEGTTFFFTLEFEELQSNEDDTQESFSNISASILSTSNKSKKQELYIQEYLNYFGASCEIFTKKEEFIDQSSDTNFDLVFIDYEYLSENELFEYAKRDEKLVLLAKSHYRKDIESLNAEIYKVLYEPVNITKTLQLLKNYENDNRSTQKQIKQQSKKLDLKSSKFDAKILVAEDNIINQKLIKKTLEELGLDITIASNGLEAVEKRKEGDFDMIFMDIQMPYLDGMEATKEIIEYEKEHNKAHIPIVALTANALKGDRERFIACGMDEYTTKPIVRTKIISLLNHFLSNHSTVETGTYKADILLAKKTMFETKLYTKIIESLGYSYEIAKSSEALNDLVSKEVYKLVLFDKGNDGLDLQSFAKKTKESAESKNLDTYLALIEDTSDNSNEDDILYVHEILDNVIDKDKLKELFERFITGSEK